MTIKCTAHCKDCGRQTPNVSWSPGVTCPQCGSAHFTPVPVIRRGSDYEEADRSQGFAIEDIRFGRLAVWAGMISPKRFEQALHQQRQVAASQGRAPDFGTFLLQRKDITQYQFEAIVACMNAIPGNAADEEFAKAALHQGVIEPAQVSQCQALQMALVQGGRDAPPLPLIMHEQRILQEVQILALLRAAETRGWGLLHRINLQAQERAKSRLERWFGSAERPAIDPRMAIALGVLVIALTIFGVRVATRPARAATECVNCHALGGASEDSSWPLMCTECGMKEVYPRGLCTSCGEKFPVKSSAYGLSCPKCGSSKIVLITDRDDLEEPKQNPPSDSPDLDDLER